MVPLGNVLTVIGCLGALVMVPHFVMPKKMVQLFIEKFPIDKEGTAAKQLELFHMGLFSQLFFLAVLLAIVGQTCPCLPAAGLFCVIIIGRIAQAGWALTQDDIGLARKPVMMQVIIGTLLLVVVIVTTIMAAGDDEFLAAQSAMEATSGEKFDKTSYSYASPIVFLLVGAHLFFALMSAAQFRRNRSNSAQFAAQFRRNSCATRRTSAQFSERPSHALHRSAPGICVAEKMIDGYLPHKKPKDRYALAQMKFYMAFQSREQLGYNLFFSAAILMAPNPMPYAVYVIAVGVYFVAFCINNIIKADVYGFALPGMLFFLITWSFLTGATFTYWLWVTMARA